MTTEASAGYGDIRRRVHRFSQVSAQASGLGCHGIVRVEPETSRTYGGLGYHNGPALSGRIRVQMPLIDLLLPLQYGSAGSGPTGPGHYGESSLAMK